MVQQVQVVAILMIANGTILTFMGLYNAVLVPALYGFVLFGPAAPPSPGGSADFTIITVMGGLQLLLGVVILAAAVLHIVAGIRCLRFRGRILAIVALFSNLTSLFTCWCIPTSVAMMVYGLIVLFQTDVAHAFAEVAAGASPEEVKYARRHPDDQDDFDEPAPRASPSRQSDNVQLAPDEYHRRPPNQE